MMSNLIIVLPAFTAIHPVFGWLQYHKLYRLVNACEWSWRVSVNIWCMVNI